MKTELLRFNGAVKRDLCVDAWMKEHRSELGAIAHRWLRRRIHIAGKRGILSWRSPARPRRLLEGSEKFMRHVRLGQGVATPAAALNGLIQAAYSDIKARVENG